MLRVAGAGAMTVAPSVLLLHGYFGSGVAWRRVARDVGDRARLLTPDLPGFGSSAGDVRRPIDLDALLEPLVPLVRSHAPLSVVGHSLGGLVALALAAAEPGAVERVGTISLPVFESPRSGYAHQSARGLVRRAVMLMHPWSHPLCALARHTVPLWWPFAHLAYPRYPRMAMERLFLHHPAAHVDVLDGIVFAGLLPRLAAGVRVPVGVLHGSLDPAAPFAASKVFAQQAGWSFTPVPGASHHLLFDRPATVADWILGLRDGPL